MSLYNVQLVTLEKDADQSVSSSTTLANDTHLTLPVAAGRRYKFFGCLRFNLAGIISGYKFGWSTPASPTEMYYDMRIINGATGAFVLGAISATIAGALATSGDHGLMIGGHLSNGANAGNLVFQFAQNASDSGAITVKQNSWLSIVAL